MGYLVSFAFEFLDWNTRIQIHGEGNAMPGNFPRFEILDFSGLLRGAAISSGDGTNAGACSKRIEAGSHNHGEHKLVPAIDVRKSVKVFQIHQDFFAWLDVGDGLREDVGAFLGKEGSDVA